MKTYNDPQLTDLVQQQLDLHGLSEGQLSPEKIFTMDQFHLGGPAPLMDLLSRNPLPDEASVLDLGSGFGGVSRLVASQSTARILGIDQEANYVEIARSLTKRCQLDDRVQFRQGDIASADFGNAAYDAAFLAHVQMNIACKAPLFSNIHKALKPGAPLFLWEVFSHTPDTLPYPLPWALSGDESHVVSPDAAHADLEAAGFTVTNWDDKTDWVKNWALQIRENGVPPGPFLGAIIPRGKERLGNIGAALLSDKITVIAGVAHA